MLRCSLAVHDDWNRRGKGRLAGRALGWLGRRHAGRSGLAEYLREDRLVNDQCLSLVDALDEKISTIGISAFLGSEHLPVSDVQIHDEGDQIEGSFRLVA